MVLRTKCLYIIRAGVDDILPISQLFPRGCIVLLNVNDKSIASFLHQQQLVKFTDALTAIFGDGCKS